MKYYALLVAHRSVPSIICKLQPFLLCFRRRGTCRWVLKETARDITRLVKRHVRCATKTRRPLKGSTFSTLIHEFSFFFLRIEGPICCPRTTPPVIVASLPLPVRLGIASKELCTRKLRRSIVGTWVVWPHACLLRIIPHSHRDNSGIPCKSPRQAWYGLIGCTKIVSKTCKEIASDIMHMYIYLILPLKLLQDLLSAKCDDIFTSSVTCKNRGISVITVWDWD